MKEDLLLLAAVFASFRAGAARSVEATTFSGVLALAFVVLWIYLRK